MSSLKVPSKVYPFENFRTPLPFLRSSQKSPMLLYEYLHRIPNIHRSRRNYNNQRVALVKLDFRYKVYLCLGTYHSPNILNKQVYLTDRIAYHSLTFYCPSIHHHSDHHLDSKTYLFHVSYHLICILSNGCPFWNALRQMLDAFKARYYRLFMVFWLIWDRKDKCYHLFYLGNHSYFLPNSSQNMLA